MAGSMKIEYGKARHNHAEPIGEVPQYAASLLPEVRHGLEATRDYFLSCHRKLEGKVDDLGARVDALTEALCNQPPQFQHAERGPQYPERRAPYEDDEHEEVFDGAAGFAPQPCHARGYRGADRGRDMCGRGAAHGRGMHDGVGFAQHVAVDDGIGRIKISIPSFNGKAEPEEYLDWEMRVEQIFDSHHYTEYKKIRLATIEFTGYALVWWNQLCRVGARPDTWIQLKNILRRRFVPAHYTRTLYNRLQQLHQGNSSVDEYYKEMEMLMIRTGIEEHDEATMARFFNGLNGDVQDRVEMVHYYNIQDLVHQAERAEQ